MNSALATAVFILNIEGTVHMGNIFKDILDALSTPEEPVKAEPKSKGLGARNKSSGSFGEAFAAAREEQGGGGGVFDYKGKSYTTNIAGENPVAKLYKAVVTEQNKDDRGNTPVRETTSVAYSRTSDDEKDLLNQGYYPDKIIRDSMRSGKLGSSTPRRNVTKEALDDIEAEIEKSRRSAARSTSTGRYDINFGVVASEPSSKIYEKDIDRLEHPSLKKSLYRPEGSKYDYFGYQPRDDRDVDFDAFEDMESKVEPSFYEKYIKSGKTGLGIDLFPKQKRLGPDPLNLANPLDILNNTKEIKSAQSLLTNLGYKPNGIDGKIGGGTRRAVRKLQKQHGLPITGRLTQNTVDLLNAKNVMSYPDAPKPKAKVITFTNSQLNLFGDEVANIESSNRYNVTGGSGDHYLGRYQMGADALSDVGRNYTTSLNKVFLNDPKLQDKLFEAYTLNNHTHLTKNSSIYRSMSPEEKLGILGYAHNQGATAAEEYLFTGVVGEDAFGTKGTKYVKAMQNALASLSGTP